MQIKTEIPLGLKTHPFINPLSEGETKSITSLPRKGTIVTSGDASLDMHVVLSGRIALQQSDPNESRLPLTTALIGPGQIFGFEALNKKPFAADARAEIASTILSLPMTRVDELFQTNEVFANEFARQLAEAEESAQNFRVLHASGDGLQRVSGALLDYSTFADQMGYVYVTQIEIGQRAAFSREETNDAVTFLNKKEAINNFSPGEIQIVNVAILERYRDTLVKKRRKSEQRV